MRLSLLVIALVILAVSHTRLLKVTQKRKGDAFDLGYRLKDVGYVSTNIIQGSGSVTSPKSVSQLRLSLLSSKAECPPLVSGGCISI